MARTARILSKADKFKPVPTKPPTNDLGRKFECLHAVRRHHNIGASEQAALPAEALIGAL